MRIRRWAENGVLERLFEALQAHQPIRVSMLSALVWTAPSIKLHPDGTGALKTVRNPSANPRGWTTKVHMVSANDRCA